MSRHTLAVAIGAALLIGSSGHSFAGTKPKNPVHLKLRFTKKTSSAVVGACEVHMTGRDKHKKDVNLGPFRDQDLVWTIENDSKNGCKPNGNDFDYNKVSLLFTSDLFPKRTLTPTSSLTITAHTTKDMGKAGNGSVHRYTVLYDNLDAGDPEVEVSDDMGDTGPGGGSGGSGGSSSGGSSGSSSTGTKQSGAAKK